MAEPTSVQDEPQNYSVNNNSIHRSPSPPGPAAPPPNPVTAIRNESSSSAAKVNANRNLPTPPKKRRLSALNSTGPEVNRPEDESSNGKLVDEPEVNPTSPNKDESHVKKRASPGDAVSPRGSSAVVDGGAANLVSERSASSSRSSPTSLQLTALAAAAATGGASTTTSSDTSSPSPRGSLIIGDRSLANRHRLNASATTSLSSAAGSARQNDRQILLRGTYITTNTDSRTFTHKTRYVLLGYTYVHSAHIFVSSRTGFQILISGVLPATVVYDNE